VPINKLLANIPSLASDEITWKKPRSIAIVLAWSVINVAILLNVFLLAGQTMEWYFMALLFSVSVYAGMILEDLKAIILGVFEALGLTMILAYLLMILPALVGAISGFYQQNLVLNNAVGYLFKMMFPLGVVLIVLGGLIGGILKDWLY
jgi:hypothetical protein